MRSAQLRREHDALCRLALKLDRKQDEVEYDSAFERALVGDPKKMAKQKRDFAEPLWLSAQTGDLELYKTIEAAQGEKRGQFGETVMHILFLFWPRNDADRPRYERFLRYLVKAHPSLINTVYDQEPYVGEHVLHMAIVSNDLPAVKLLVEHGAKLDVPATGAFFKPYGNWYQGAYPLSFAVVSRNKDIVQYLLERGADPFLRDEVLGMNVMHICVVYSLPDMFDLVLDWITAEEKAGRADRFKVPPAETGDDSSIIGWLSGRLASQSRELEMTPTKPAPSPALNLLRSVTNFRRTPLTLAAELGKQKMFIHIMGKEKELLWRYGTVQASAYPLDELDTYPMPERNGRLSALELIVYIAGSQDEDMERSRVLDATPINQLVQQKWEDFAAYWYYAWFLIYFGYLIIFTIAAVDAPELDFFPGSRIALHLIVLIGAILMLALELRDVLTLGKRYFTERGTVAFFALIWIFCLLIFVIAVLEYGFYGQYDVAKAILLAIASLFAWSYLLFFLRGQKTVGVLVVMLQEMMFGDIMRWVVIYVVLLFGFATGFVALFHLGTRYADLSNPDTTYFYNNFSIAVQSLYTSLYGDFSTLGQFDGNLSKGMTVAMFVGYSILANVLMLNLLIAMLNFTFARIQDRARIQWKREWVSIILLIERRMPFFLRNYYRSGKVGKTLGARRENSYYIILEEKIEGPAPRHGDLPGERPAAEMEQAEIMGDVTALTQE